VKNPGLPLGKLDHAAIRALARLVAEEIAGLLGEREGTLPGADVSPRRRKEMDPWREEESPSERSDRIDTSENGESSWSEMEASELLRITRAKKRQGRSSGP
jgi:hypothetical protein